MADPSPSGEHGELEQGGELGSSEDLLAILENADQLDISREQPNRPSNEAATDQVEVDALWMVVCTRLLALGISPGIVLSRSILAEWFLEYRKSKAAQLFEQDDWRSEALGGWLCGFISGDRSLIVEWGERGANVREQQAPEGTS